MNLTNLIRISEILEKFCKNIKYTMTLIFYQESLGDSVGQFIKIEISICNADKKGSVRIFHTLLTSFNDISKIQRVEYLAEGSKMFAELHF